MKKLTNILLAGVMSVSLAACGGSAASASASTSETTQNSNVSVNADGLLNDGVFTVSMECAYAP